MNKCKSRKKKTKYYPKSDEKIVRWINMESLLKEIIIRMSIKIRQRTLWLSRERIGEIRRTIRKLKLI